MGMGNQIFPLSHVHDKTSTTSLQEKGRLHITEFVTKNYHRDFLISTYAPTGVLCVNCYDD